MIFQILNFLLQLLDFLERLFILFALESIHGLQKPVWVLDFVFDQRPQLLEKSAEIFRFLLRLLQLLVE